MAGTHGVLMTDRLADKLGVQPGDTVTLQVREGRRQERQVVVERTVRDMMGLNSFMERTELLRLLGEAPQTIPAMVAVMYKGLDPRLTMLFEASANFWRYGPTNSSDSNAVLAVSPVLRYPLGQALDLQWGLEFGIGVSLLDDTRFAGKDVSTHYQFEDRLGLVAWVSPTESLTLRYLHYSNAGLSSNNDGVENYSLHYAMTF